MVDPRLPTAGHRPQGTAVSEQVETDLDALTDAELLDLALVAKALGHQAPLMVSTHRQPPRLPPARPGPAAPKHRRRPARRELRRAAAAARRRDRRPADRRGRRRSARPHRTRGTVAAGRVEHPRALRLARLRQRRSSGRRLQPGQGTQRDQHHRERGPWVVEAHSST